MNHVNDESSYTSADVDLVPWEPRGLLRRVSRRDVELSRGFLRSKPERWVPNLVLQWLPLIHSVNAEIRVVEVRPLASAPSVPSSGVMVALGEHYMAVVADSQSRTCFIDAIVPDSGPKAGNLVLEYLARRLAGSLAISWVGHDPSRVQVFGGGDVEAQEYGGAVKIATLVNGRQATVWLLLSVSLVDELDRLWRLQLHSTNRTFVSPKTVSLEIAQLAVPSSALPEYLRSGQAVDLDVVMSDNMILRLDETTCMSARLCEVESQLCCEIVSSNPIVPVFPEGFERFSVILGTVNCEPPLLAELVQSGAILDTSIPLGDKVELWVNGRREGYGALRSYMGRFAVEVD